MKIALVVLVSLSFISLGSALKCQTYTGTSKTDNGQETECATGLDACLYSSVGKFHSIGPL